MFLKSIGMPINFTELGAKEKDIPTLAEKFGIGDGTTGGFMNSMLRSQNDHII